MLGPLRTKCCSWMSPPLKLLAVMNLVRSRLTCITIGASLSEPRIILKLERRNEKREIGNEEMETEMEMVVTKHNVTRLVYDCL